MSFVKRICLEDSLMSDIFFILIFHCVTYLSSQNYDNHPTPENFASKYDDKKEVLAILEKHKMGANNSDNPKFIRIKREEAQ